MRSRAAHVLGKPNAEVAAELRAAAGQWLLIGGGPEEQLPLLRSTAYRIRKGQMLDFPDNEYGSYRARVSNAKDRVDPVAPVEVFGMFVPAPSPSGPGTSPTE